MIHDPATCARCGANAWTSCKHREALREKPVFVDAPDKREVHARAAGGGRYSFRSVGKGINFKTRKRRSLPRDADV